MKRKGQFLAGQSTLEYAILIAVVVGALLAMRYYMSRGLQGKLRESADSIGEQYSAGSTTSTYTTEQLNEMKTKETFGRDTDGTTFKQGVSRYEVNQAAVVVRNASGEAAEQITTSLNQEALFK